MSGNDRLSEIMRVDHAQESCGSHTTDGIAPAHRAVRLLAAWSLTIGILIGAGVCAANQGDLEAGAYRLKVDLSTLRLPGAPTAEKDKNAGEQSEPAPRAAALDDKPFAAQIDRAAIDAELDPALVHAVIFVESRYNPAARSPKGALGLMQVMPQTASRYGVKNVARSIDENLRAGTRYLSDLMRQFAGRLDLVLAAYNAGEHAVVRHLGIPPFTETRRYVPAVMAKYEEWRSAPPAVEAPAAPSTPVVPRVEYLPGTRLDASGSHRIPQ